MMEDRIATVRADLAAIRRGERSIAEVAAPLGPPDLRALTDELVGEARALIADAVDADVVFVPDDPNAAEGEEGWTIGHIVAHATAGSEEAAASALTLARGAALAGRPRYETPWQEIRTVEQVVRRLEESRRMRLAMLAAWPDEPHLDNTAVMVERFGPLNAVSCYLLGPMHEDGHLPQLAEVVRQARAARGVSPMVEA